MEKHYEHLGWKTFWIFVSQRSKVAIVIGLFALVMLLLPQSGVFHYFAQGLLTLFLVAILLTILVCLVEYMRFEFLLDDDALRLRRGVLHHEEISIPYRQIQDIDIVRDVLNQVTGTARLVILTAGHEDPGEAGADSEGDIPVIDRKLAERLEAELSRRANVQKVTNV